MFISTTSHWSGGEAVGQAWHTTVGGLGSTWAPRRVTARLPNGSAESGTRVGRSQGSACSSGSSQPGRATPGAGGGAEVGLGGVGLGGKGVGVPAGCAVDRASQTNFAFAPQPRPARVPVRPGVLLARPLCPVAPPHGPACIRALRLPRPAWPRISRFTQRPLRFVGARQPMSAFAIAVATAGQKFENVMLLQNGTDRNIASLAYSNIFGICVVSM